jgi:hypothetical protein
MIAVVAALGALPAAIGFQSARVTATRESSLRDRTRHRSPCMPCRPG